MNKEQFLDAFQTTLATRFTGTQNWWTKSLFHFTDITNAISILATWEHLGKMRQRNLKIA